MTTASGGVAVIATQLAQTDRRALSQAWYSALHVTHPPAPLRAHATAARVLPAGAPATNVRATPGHRAAPPALAPAMPRAQRRASAPAGPATERRRPVTETVRRIERAVATLSARPHAPAAHTVDLAGGRVRLLVRNDGRTTRIVALCSDPLRGQVERALASARFALAGAGLAAVAP
jgi:hypothetical protein